MRLLDEDVPVSIKQRKLTRRRVLIGAGGLAGCCVLGVSVPAIIAIRGPEEKSDIGELEFRNQLAIPPLLEPDIDADGVKHFDLTLQTGSATIFPEGDSETWGVNGPFLGPTLRAKRGEAVAIDVNNELPEDTSIHWHGMHLPARMDGGPHQMIGTGETWSTYWTIEQPASTLWYHPHPHGQTAEHVYRGIAGLFLIDDDEEAALDLPRTYGVDDIPLILQDKRVKENGEFDRSAGGSFLDNFQGSTSFGILGDRILINGTYDPAFEVTSSIMRFRLLNGSNARFYNLGFTDDRPFRLLATENGLLGGELPELTRLMLGPGERAEILVRFSPGDETILRSFKLDRDLGKPIGSDDTFDLVRFTAPGDLAADRDLPTSVLPERSLDLRDGLTERRFELQSHKRINGEEMDMNRIDVVVPSGAMEIWNVESNDQPHTFHIHGATFHVLEADGGEPDVHIRGPKDTVLVEPDHPVRLAVQFISHVDPEMPYMFHCHLLKHEDNGMMGQFVVVEPGMEDATPRRLDSGHSGH
jgi:FtsP/CotA-like multicopper oxidase with cupredoxin domain